jgi:hypothetical protein
MKPRPLSTPLRTVFALSAIALALRLCDPRPRSLCQWAFSLFMAVILWRGGILWGHDIADWQEKWKMRHREAWRREETDA